MPTHIKITGPDTNDKVVHNIYPEGMPVNPDMMDPNIGGSLRKCKHVYEYVNTDICPYCGRYTHEPDYEFQNNLHRQWIAEGKHLVMQCPLGGTIRGWWDI